MPEVKTSGEEDIAATAKGTKGVSTLALDKRLRKIERDVSVGQFCAVRVLKQPERFVRALYLGQSPDNLNSVVVFNAHFGVKEFPNEDVRF